MTGTVVDMEPMKDLGERIKTERIAQGYGVKAAAQGAGIARDTWRKIEEGGSVHDTKRHAAMAFLGLSDKNTEWGTVGSLEDHAADPSKMMDLNLMFSQAVRFAATIGILVPEVREESERVNLALSELFARAYQLWDRGDPLDKYDTEPVELTLHSTSTGGDGHADADAGGSASTSDDNYDDLAADEEYELTPQDEAEQTETST